MNDNKYQNLLTKLQTADEEEREWIVMEFSLQNLSETLLQAVWAAAIPHWFDYDFLNAIIGNPLKDSDFKFLIGLSFVEVFPERGFNIHERSRHLLLNYLWEHNKTRFQRLSKRAAAYCKKQDQSITIWRVETLYHGLLANNLTAKDDFISQGVNWHNSFQYDKLENLTQALLEAVNLEKLTGDVASWVYDFQAELDTLYNRYDSAKKNYSLALKQNIKNKSLKADCLFDLGILHQSLSEYEKAIEYQLQALSIYQKIKNRLGEANCILGLGKVHFSLGQYLQARDFYERALKIYKQIQNPLGEANYIRLLGNVHSALAEYEEARDCYERATPIYNAIGNKRSMASCFGHVADTYRRQKQFAQALAAINQAIEIDPDNANWYHNRTAIYIDMEDYQSAEADIKRTERMREDIAYTLLHKAAIALWQQHPAQATELGKQAVELRPANGNFRALWALTLLANGQLQEAINEMQQALTAIYQLQDFENLLEDLDKLIHIYGDSSEFTTMREIICKHSPSRSD